ncbi:MAG: nucleoid-associated protein [Bacillota bacterium]|nr:nucleoid-associated protein [Bacillota bacterium]
MELRYLEDVSIKKAIIHVLDKGGDEPVLNDELLDIGDAFLNEFITKHVIKSLSNDSAENIVFNKDEFIIQYLNKLQDNESFIEYSKKIARKLFGLIKSDEAIPSSDLIICELSNNGKRFYGILKLDYQLSYTHEIDYIDDKFQVSLKPYTIGLPASSQQLKKCVFISESNDDYSGLLLNVDKKSDNEFKRNYFVTEFIKAKREIDNTQKTKIIKKEVENWTRKNLKEDIDKASDLREKLNECLIEDDDISIEEITKEFLTVEQNEDMRNHIEKKGINFETPINVDKKWVEKKMKSKSIKTDTGVTIKGDLEIFKDNAVFEMKRNGDGTVDYIIKNVRNILER